MEEIVDLEKKWGHWHYHNTALLVLSIVVFIILADTPIVLSVISGIGDFGYLGAFLVGILFVSIFTVAPASVILFQLADTLNPLGIALAAGAGGVLGDYLILRYLKDWVFSELTPLFQAHGGKILKKLFKTPYFAWVVPILGATIIASPIPDEVGISLLGLSKIKPWQFLVLTFSLNSIGIFLIIIAARSF